MAVLYPWAAPGSALSRGECPCGEKHPPEVMAREEADDNPALEVLCDRCSASYEEDETAAVARSLDSMEAANG